MTKLQSVIVKGNKYKTDSNGQIVEDENINVIVIKDSHNFITFYHKYEELNIIKITSLLQIIENKEYKKKNRLRIFSNEKHVYSVDRVDLKEALLEFI